METKKITDVPGIQYLWQVDNLFLAGQPSAETIESMAQKGVKKIINLRSEGEFDQTEIKNKASELGLEYEQFPIVLDGQLDAKNCEKLSQMINKDEPHFIHCGSANRVGGWLITYLTKHRGLDFEQSVDIASQNGLSNPGFIAQAQDIVEG